MKKASQWSMFGIVGIAILGLVSGCSSDSSTTGTGQVCGNSIIEQGEECDSGSLDGKDCEYFGFLGGSLGCSDQCSFDFSGCESRVGHACDDPGRNMCEGDRAIECTQDNEWVLIEDCGESGRTCTMDDGRAICTGTSDGTNQNNGTCDDPCPEEGATRCSSDGGAIEECTQGDDGCLAWATHETCEGMCQILDSAPVCTPCEVMDEEDNSREGTPQSIPQHTNWCFSLSDQADIDEDCLVFDATEAVSLAFALHSLQSGVPCASVEVTVYKGNGLALSSVTLDCDTEYTPEPSGILSSMEPGEYLVCLSHADPEGQRNEDGYFEYWFVSPPRAPKPNDVVFTEIYAGSTGEREGEWFELLNLTDDYLDLQGCRLVNGEGDEKTLFDQVLVAPHERFVISNTMAEFNMPMIVGKTSYSGELIDTSYISGRYGRALSVALSLDCPDDGGQFTTIDSMNGVINDARAFQVDPSLEEDPFSNDDVNNGCLSVAPFIETTIQDINPSNLIRAKGTPGMPNHTCTGDVLYQEDFGNGWPAGWSGDGDVWSVSAGQLHGEIDKGEGEAVSNPMNFGGRRLVVISCDVTLDLVVTSAQANMGISDNGQEFMLMKFDPNGSGEDSLHIDREYLYLDGSGDAAILFQLSNSGIAYFPSTMDIDNVVIEALDQ